jgi:riboflavin kinase/FMN adenylyltransferase
VKLIRYNSKTKITDSEPKVIALGFFDGVHLGHRKLLKATIEEAKKRNIEASVFTFPNESLAIKSNSQRIYTTENKLSIFESLGIDTVILADFNDICMLTPEDFVDKVLISELNCPVSVSGYNFRFGKQASGDAKKLESLMKAAGKSSIILPEETYEGRKLSTTEIREAMRSGNIFLANKMLGAPYFIDTEPTHGIGLGHKLGFPTVNSSFEEFSPPLKKGVYRSVVKIDSEYYSAISNIGNCPTFGDRSLHAETYIIDYNQNIYGKKIRIFFLDFIRDEKKFESSKELIMQINVDKNKVIKENGDLKWQEIGLN